MPLKDHVSKSSKRINARLNKMYNLTLNDFENALFGTIEQQYKAQQKIGQAGRESKLALEMLPQIKQHFIDNINATTQYNQTKAELIKTAGNSMIAIDRANMSAMLANTQYGNKRGELAREFVAAKEAENFRHQLETNYIVLKAMIEKNLQRVDGEAKLIEQVNRPQLKQIDENLSYQQKTAKHLLGYGDSQNVELLHKKQYKNEALEGAKGFLSKVADKIGLYF